MNDVGCRQAPAGGDDSLTGFAATLAGPNPAAFFQNGGATGTMNGTIDPASAEQAGIGSVDNGGNCLARDVALHQLNAAGRSDGLYG